MIIKNAKLVLHDKIIENGFIEIENGLIKFIGEGTPISSENVIDAKGNIIMPGFIDLHIHGSVGIDFMDAKKDEYKLISESLYKEGVTSYLATTLTSDNASLINVCHEAKEAVKDNPSLLGIHLEGPYISAKFKGAQNEAFIRNPDIKELEQLIKESNGLVKYISMAPEKEGAIDFIKYATTHGVTVSAGHSDASFKQVEDGIKVGLTNVTHTHNAQSGHHHRNPGVVTAAMYFNELFCEVICDRIHVCDDTLKAFYRIAGPDRFMIITDALKIKHSQEKTLKLFGLDCEVRDGAAYLLSGPLAGSILSFDQGVRNIKEITNASLIDLAKISSYNQAKSLHLTDRGELKVGYLADLVILDKNLNIINVYKKGDKVA